jgi:hypothetical protein
MEGFYTGKRVHHPELGSGRVVSMDENARRITVSFEPSGIRSFPVEDAVNEFTDPPARDESEDTVMDTEDMVDVMKEALMELGLAGITPIGDKWDGGELLLKPGREGLQEKPIPIGTFFHKIVMVRNQLRMLEQSINASKGLTDSEKVDMQQYITRCYGSLTTFNVLFSDKKDWFKGSKSG